MAKVVGSNPTLRTKSAEWRSGGMADASSRKGPYWRVNSRFNSCLRHQLSPGGQTGKGAAFRPRRCCGFESRSGHQIEGWLTRGAASARWKRVGTAKSRMSFEYSVIRQQGGHRGRLLNWS